MTAVNDLLMSPDTGPNGQIKRDRYGRYLLPHPETGKEQAWTRATTLANTLADRFALQQWDERNIVLGLGERRDLYAQAAAAKPEDKDLLNGIVKDAKEAARAKAGANLGSAVHQFTERIDRGEVDLDVPEPWSADVEAYCNSLTDAQINVVEGWVERVVCVPGLGVAGTLDRLLESPRWHTPRIADLKTGKDVVRYGMTEIALQLAIYAHASHWWDGTAWHEMPTIDRKGAVVMHVPVGQGRCTLYAVDIGAGWQAVQLAVAVREWRNRKDLATPYDPTDGFEQRLAWLRTRVQRIVEAGHGNELAAVWDPGIPTFKQGGPRSHQHIDLIAGMCSGVEQMHAMSFGEPDPATATTEREQQS